MKKGAPSFMLILNNKIFDNPKLNRDGTEKDAERLTEVFQKRGFQVFEEKDLSANVCIPYLLLTDVNLEH